MKLFKEWIQIKTVQKQLVKVGLVIVGVLMIYYAWGYYPFKLATVQTCVTLVVEQYNSILSI